MHRPIIRSATLLAHLSEKMRQRIGKPSRESFYSRAFDTNRATAEAVANTRYLRSMQDGTLDPLAYGCLTVQDAYYCYSARDTLVALLERDALEGQPDLKELLEAKVDEYDVYNRTFLDDWHLRNAESVMPTETMSLYAAHERRVALEEDPIYALVAYLPCHCLWPWFARRLMMSPRYQPGVYRGWFETIYPSESVGFGPAWLLGSFIEEWIGAGKPFDESLAMDIYRSSMDFELKLFSEACES